MPAISSEKPAQMSDIFGQGSSICVSYFLLAKSDISVNIWSLLIALHATKWIIEPGGGIEAEKP